MPETNAPALFNTDKYHLAAAVYFISFELFLFGKIMCADEFYL